MLVLKLNDQVPTIITNLLTEFRRHQVSRFPIEVEVHESDHERLRFVDSRFPNTSWRVGRVLALLELDGEDKNGKPIFKVTSRLISNDKYASHNESYNTKETSDPKKALKLLKDYVKPYSAQEVAYRSFERMGHRYNDWVTEPASVYGEIVSGITRSDIAEEVVRLKMAGVEFHTEKFQRIAEQGVEHYNEAKRRNRIKSCKTHLLVQPDNSVVITHLPNGPFAAGTATFENMEVVPTCVQQAVAMLRMVDAEAFVPETGMRVADNEFWIEINPDEFNSSNT